MYRKSNARVTVGAGETHQLSLEVETKGRDNTWVFDADEFEIKAVKGPGGQVPCRTATL